MAKFLQFLIMAAIGCALIWFQENVYHQKINPYIIVGCVIGVPYLLTVMLCSLLDWRIRRRAAALERQQEAHRFVRV